MGKGNTRRPGERDDITISEQRKIAAELRKKGKTLTEIAAVTGTHATTVRRDLMWVNEQILAEAKAHGKQHRKNQIAKIRQAQQIALEIIEKNFKESIETIDQTIDTGNKTIKKNTTKKKKLSGSSDALRALMEAIKEESRLLGLYEDEQEKNPEHQKALNSLIGAIGSLVNPVDENEKRHKEITSHSNDTDEEK